MAERWTWGDHLRGFLPLLMLRWPWCRRLILLLYFLPSPSKGYIRESQSRRRIFPIWCIVRKIIRWPSPSWRRQPAFNTVRIHHRMFCSWREVRWRWPWRRRWRIRYRDWLYPSIFRPRKRHFKYAFFNAKLFFCTPWWCLALISSLDFSWHISILNWNKKDLFRSSWCDNKVKKCCFQYPLFVIPKTRVFWFDESFELLIVYVCSA